MRCAPRGLRLSSWLLPLFLVMVAATPAAGYTQGSAAVSWGENWHGQLGTIYRNVQEESPVDVEGLENVTAVASGGSFSLALLGSGRVASWGGNLYGQLGDNGYKANWELGLSHASVNGLSGVTAISAGNEYALALLGNGTVMAWGNNQYGQLGDGAGGTESRTGQNERTPRRVEGLADVVAIASGGGSNFALQANGTVSAWGSNSSGQLGIEWPVQCQRRNTAGCRQYECETETGSELCSVRPAPVMQAAKTPLTGVVAISAGAVAAYALLKDGEVLSWGGNLKGQLGQPNVESGGRSAFTPPGKVMQSTTEALTNVIEISAGFDHALARLSSGKIVGWGDDDQGELGELGPGSSEVCQKAHPELPCERLARPINGLGDQQVEAISAGAKYSLALIAHKVFAWGRNDHGELGDGGTSSRAVPLAVAGLGSVQAVSAGYTHVVAVLASGVRPPAPLIALGTVEGQLDLTWTNEGADRQLVRVFERPGEGEAEEELVNPEEPGSPAGGGEAGQLQNTARPRIHGEAREGQLLTATAGAWTGGSEPPVFEYQWRRCKGGECVTIPGASANKYLLGSEDAGFTLNVSVTAASAREPPVTATSPPTDIVKTEEEGRRTKLESVKLRDGVHFSVIDELYGAPLEAVPYEIRLLADHKQRMIVATPLLRKRGPVEGGPAPLISASTIEPEGPAREGLKNVQGAPRVTVRTARAPRRTGRRKRAFHERRRRAHAGRVLRSRVTPARR